MSKKIIKSYNKLIAFVLSVLGLGSSVIFSGCEDKFSGCEYGTPHADFKVSGVVKNSSEEAVKGMKVVMQRTDGYDKDSTYTDENGNYNVTVEDFPDSQTFSMEFVDIDSSENGLLQDVDTAITFDNPVFENGDGSWYDGETSQEFNISMKEK